MMIYGKDILLAARGIFAISFQVVFLNYARIMPDEQEVAVVRKSRSLKLSNTGKWHFDFMKSSLAFYIVSMKLII